MQFFKPPKIETILMFVVSVCTSKFSRFHTKSSQIVAYEFHQCGLFNLIKGLFEATTILHDEMHAPV